MKCNTDCSICTLDVFWKVKVTAAPVHTMQWAIVPLTLNHATRRSWMVSFMPWLFHLQTRWYPLNGGLGETQSQEIQP